MATTSLLFMPITSASGAAGASDTFQLLTRERLGALSALCDTKSRRCIQGTPTDESGGCGCSTPGHSSPNRAALGLLVAAALVAVRVRRGTARPR